MKKALQILLFLVLVLVIDEALGQSAGLSWKDYESGRLSINRLGMALLIIWAAVNILTGILGWIFGKAVSRYFFQMNAFWNLVNLGLGLSGYLGAAGTDLSMLTNDGIVAAYHDMQNLYILNAGLDVAYIAVAFFLIERGKNISKWNDLLRGYGYSLILQGGFLLIFDLIMFFVHKSHADQYLYPLMG